MSALVVCLTVADVGVTAGDCCLRWLEIDLRDTQSRCWMYLPRLSIQYELRPGYVSKNWISGVRIHENLRRGISSQWSEYDLQLNIAKCTK